MEAVNPYQSPTGDLTTDVDERGDAKLFSPASRSGRIRYLARIMTVMLLGYLAMIPTIGAVVAIGTESGGMTMMVLLMVAIWGAISVLSIIFMIQRLHDLNASGWMSLLSLVPLVNIFFGFYLMFWPGTEGANDYGNPPPPTKWFHWVLALIFPILWLGVVLAVSIPAYQGYVERAQQMQMSE